MMRKMQNCHSLGVWPDCPGGGKPEGPKGRRNRTVNTAAFPPEHGSMATGLGALFQKEHIKSHICPIIVVQ